MPDILEQLDTNSPIDERKRLAREFIEEQVRLVEADPVRYEKYTHSITTIYPTRFVDDLPEDDPLRDVLAIAGILDIPEDQRDDTTWQDLVRAVRNLDKEE